MFASVLWHPVLSYIGHSWFHQDPLNFIRVYSTFTSHFPHYDHHLFSYLCNYFCFVLGTWSSALLVPLLPFHKILLISSTSMPSGLALWPSPIRWTGYFRLHLASVCPFAIFLFVFYIEACELLTISGFITTTETSLGNDYVSEHSSRDRWLLAFESALWF